MSTFYKSKINFVDPMSQSDIPPRVVNDEQGKSWLFSKVRGDIHLFRNECPHQGHEFRATRNRFVCRGHFWNFDAEGSNSVTNGQNLIEVKYELDGEGNIFVIDKISLPTQSEAIQSDVGSEVTLDFLSHSSIKISNSKYAIVTDPWLSGDAYWGNWKHWPSRQERETDYEVDCIVITHEHPDHFHPVSLAKFDRNVEVLIPNFISGRIQQTLDSLGFKKIKILNFDEPYRLQESIEVRFLRPSSRWEDSITFIDFDGYKWVNLNDAGYVGNSSGLPQRVDLLTATFDVFASDFPLCWENVTSDRRSAHSRLAREAILVHLVNITKKFNAKSFLPIASFWRLDSKLGLENYMRHVHLEEIQEYFEENLIGERFFDLLPGETFEVLNQKRVNSRLDREQVRKGSLTLEASKSQIEKLQIENELSEIERNEVQNYFSSLAEVGSAFQCEPVLFTVTSLGRVVIEQAFGDTSQATRVSISAEVPHWLLRKLIRENISWEWIRIGYWATFTRDKEIYTPNFLRLLAFGKNARDIFSNSGQAINGGFDLTQASIGGLMKKNPITVSRVLNRYGLPCFACNKSNLETLQSAFDVHEIGLNEQRDIVAALNLAIGESDPFGYASSK